ncbi:XdhC family protein [Thalassotalea ponticola]|uniref:XdhC family protein n=1 Tax=Thalassotalea ponticola TaxID=1523392 RepID=UPI0025B3263E|nr:XdhC family protein [Thalassotalea ponticola]MDN3652909.1 XdhC family protein [Thalassotalea ponticola]
MQFSDIKVIEQALDRLKNNHSVWLATITHTYGSAPRPIGSIFVTDGRIRFGSISGGCLEDAFVEMIEADHFEMKNQRFIYGRHGQQEAIYGELPCGGRIELALEYIDANQGNVQHFQQWFDCAQQNIPYQRCVYWHSDQRQITPLVTCHQPMANIEQGDGFISIRYQEVFQLLLVGIGLVTEHIARLAMLNGYQVRVCDMRRELADTWQFDAQRGGVDITWMSPDEFVEQYATSHSAVLTLAHDPRLDDVALMSVFNTQAFYIGAMGSVRTTKNRLERLKRICGLNEQQLQRLHAPIGLNIGSKTPIEIAIATMADIIRVRYNIDKCSL